jgi:hypothetical protein
MLSLRTIGLAFGTLAASLGALALAACGATAPDRGGSPAGPSAPSGTSSPPGSLSRELDRSGGVIEPPAGVDPGMPRLGPPVGATPRTPVIPPPGSPGGDPSVKPK